jgi:hypothetical protein
VADLEYALREAFEAERRPLSSIGELVDVSGGRGRGGGTGRVARMLGVEPRTVERWLVFEEAGPGPNRRASPAQRTRGLTSRARTIGDRIRRLWDSPDVQADALEQRARGRGLRIDFDISFQPYPDKNRPVWRSRPQTLRLGAGAAAPVTQAAIRALRTDDAEEWAKAAALLEDQLGGLLGLPAEAEVETVHSLSVSLT